MSAGSELREQLATLSAADRAELAQFLIESLDSEPDADAAEQWSIELKRRAESIRQGTASGEPAETVMERLWKKHS